MRDGIGSLVFIDETLLGTNMIRTTVWSPVGERPVDHVPSGHRNTRRFIAALRHDGIHVSCPLFVGHPKVENVPALSLP